MSIVVSAILFPFQVVFTVLAMISAWLVWFVFDRVWDWGGAFKIQLRHRTVLESWRHYTRLFLAILSILAIAISLGGVIGHDRVLAIVSAILLPVFIILWRVLEWVWRHVFGMIIDERS